MIGIGGMAKSANRKVVPERNCPEHFLPPIDEVCVRQPNALPRDCGHST